jgi:hypothetical protein
MGIQCSFAGEGNRAAGAALQVAEEAIGIVGRGFSRDVSAMQSGALAPEVIATYCLAAEVTAQMYGKTC